MRRAFLAVTILLILIASCTSSESDDNPPSTPSPVATASPPESTVGSPPESTLGSPPTADSLPPAPFDPEVAAELRALEVANDGMWTIDNAVAAFELLLPVLETGSDDYPPIHVPRLMWYLSEHADELSADQRSLFTATAAEPANAVPAAAYLVDEAERRVYQLAAETASAEFARLTGNAFPGEIIVVNSQFGLLPGDISAGTWSAFETDIEIWRGFFESDAAFAVLEELFNEATADGSVACVIIIGERFRRRNPLPRNASIMHEVVHCHQQTIHPGGPSGFFGRPVWWMDEGYATWAGEFLVGGTSLSAPFWDAYHEGVGQIGGHHTTEGRYDGIALFSYLHDNGANGWANFERYFGDIRASSAADDVKFNEIFSRIGARPRATWAASSLQRPEYGDVWTYTTGPGIANSTVTRTPRETPVTVDGARRFGLAAGEQGTYAFEPQLRDAEALVLDLELRGGGVIRWPWGEEQVSTGATSASWCLGPECVCEDGRELGPPAPEFTESPFIHVATTGGAVTVSLSEPEDECEDEEPPPDSFGVCPSGIWQAGADETKDLLLTMYRDAGISDPTYEGGPITMTFAEDGSYRFDYQETTFSETVEGIPARIVLTGGSFGSWETDGETLTVAMEGSDVAAALYLSGELAITLDVPSSTGGGGASYTCRGNDDLEIDPEFQQPLWPYPRQWMRVDS